MITAEQIPDEVMAVFKDAWFNQSTLTTRECLTAALNAWPKSRSAVERNGSYPIIILPIQETRDE